MSLILEPPECKWGYTDTQLRRMLKSKYQEFEKWMFGRTVTFCRGSTGCGGNHGEVTYSCDFDAFLAQRGPLD